MKYTIDNIDGVQFVETNSSAGIVYTIKLDSVNFGVPNENVCLEYYSSFDNYEEKRKCIWSVKSLLDHLNSGYWKVISEPISSTLQYEIF